ncbi:MAG: tRNA uridine-5-carboxymethylaminomethyl(34) synthesis enzyme MnmG [Candidatus Firestonebacteria bacterium]
MFKYYGKYDVIVVGAGHAGCEAALAAARMGSKTALFTINMDNIAQMSCNPAIGGLAKGHLVKEIDALGGEMAKIADKTGIQFRMLNTKKGPAVHSLRAQSDKWAYQREMKRVIEECSKLDVKQEIVEKLIVESGRVTGIATNIGTIYEGKTVVLAPGTFLNGLIHIGEASYPGGRNGELSAEKLSLALKELGFELGRLKTGTNPRINKNTIDFSKTKEQPGDEIPVPFSFSTESLPMPQVACHMVYTNEETNEIIRKNIHRSPLYGGRIKGIGPRYCPSIEDKVMRFPEKTRHQIYLEPEGLESPEIYCNGLSTSLPFDVQYAFLRTIPALKNVEIMRPGYAIEYDFVPPHQIKHTLETKIISNLYFAGQINGTSGYEEAAAQGLIAGINASLKSGGSAEEFVILRSEGYIGVLIDDLVSKGTSEPYRMFTSRAEYRLVLRQDNADLRLTARGKKIGLVGDKAYKRLTGKKKKIEERLAVLKKTFLPPTKEVNRLLKTLHTSPIKEKASAAELLRRPEIKYKDLENYIKAIKSENARLEAEISEQVEIHIKYEGYIKRQNEQIEKRSKLEHIKIPASIDYKKLHGLSAEAIEKLTKIKPETLGQAERISGIGPSDVTIIMIEIKKHS